MVFSFRGHSFTWVEFIAFFCGMAIMVVEIIGARMFVPYYGNTFFVWTSIIGVVMVSMSLGYYKGGVEADREGSREGLANIVFMAALYTSLLPLTVMLAGMFAGLGQELGTLVGSVVSLALPSYYLAKVSPYCIRLTSRSVDSAGRTSGFIYSISTVGSIFGTFISGFVLMPYFKIKTIVLMLGVLLLAISLFLNFKKKIIRLLDVVMIAGPIVIQIIWLQPEYIMPNSTVLFEGDTVYNSITVSEFKFNESMGNVRVLQVGNLIQGGIFAKYNKSFYDYVSLTQIPWLFKPDIKNVLFLGNGAGIGIDYLHAIYPEVDIDVVDIDPKVFEVATTYFSEKEGDKVHFFADDARLFLKKKDKKYDLIIMDVYSSTRQIPFHLTTYEMIREVDNHLTNDGVYVQNVISSLEGKNSMIIKSIGKTLEPTFSRNYAIPANPNNTLGDTILIISLKGDNAIGDVEKFLEKVPEPEKESVNKSIRSYVLNNFTVNTSEGIFLTDEYSPTEIMSL
ncbi:MAG: methyltransferase [Candidatus Altiarchaeales archaeon]|nr:methyltransferase [Candidatus Altiarchaeales archaeon]